MISLYVREEDVVISCLKSPLWWQYMFAVTSYIVVMFIDSFLLMKALARQTEMKQHLCVQHLVHAHCGQSSEVSGVTRQTSCLTLSLT